jgi:hypothetical protein
MELLAWSFGPHGTYLCTCSFFAALVIPHDGRFRPIMYLCVREIPGLLIISASQEYCDCTLVEILLAWSLM